MKSAVIPLPIDEEWVEDAHCARPRTLLPPMVWDAELDDDEGGETELQRDVRHRIAQFACREFCPVVVECYEHAASKRARRVSPGVRGGHPFT